MNKEVPMLELTLDVPITELLFEPDITEVPEQTINSIVYDSYSARQLAADQAKAMGYLKGSLVVDRKTAPFLRDDPKYWGIIYSITTFTIHKEFAPLEIRWYSGITKYQFPNELYIVQKKPTDQEIAQLKLRP